MVGWPGLEARKGFVDSSRRQHSHSQVRPLAEIEWGVVVAALVAHTDDLSPPAMLVVPRRGGCGLGPSRGERVRAQMGDRQRRHYSRLLNDSLSSPEPASAETLDCRSRRQPGRLALLSGRENELAKRMVEDRTDEPDRVDCVAIRRLLVAWGAAGRGII